MKVLKASVWLLCFWQITLYAQKTSSETILILQVDNDVLVPKEEDNYYTSGVFISCSQKAEKFLFWDKQENEDLFWTASIGQQMYTPVYPNSTYIGNYDRPFAGWLSGALKITELAEDHSWQYGMEAGVTGPLSLGKQLQQGFHKLAGIEERPLWIDQIPSEFMMNLSMAYSCNISPSLVFDLDGTVGTKDVYIQPGLVLLVNNYFKNYKYPAREKRLYGVLGLEYRFVGYDALIQGSIWKDNAPLTKPVVRGLITGDAGICLKLNGFISELTYVYETKSTSLAHNHIYGTIKLGYIF